MIGRLVSVKLLSFVCILYLVCIFRRTEVSRNPDEPSTSITPLLMLVAQPVQPPVTPGELYTTCLPSGPCTRHPAAPALPCELQALYESKLQISTSHGVDQIGAICADDIGPHLHNRLHRALIHARRV